MLTIALDVKRFVLQRLLTALLFFFLFVDLKDLGFSYHRIVQVLDTSLLLLMAATTRLAHESAYLGPLHRRVLVHLLHSHALVHEADPFLKGKQLLIRHDIWVDLFAEKVQPLIGYIELVEPGIVCDVRCVEVELLVMAHWWVRLEHRTTLEPHVLLVLLQKLVLLGFRVQ